ncbi:TPA: restriction endonuclease subunit S [Streptococcus suis]
MPYDIPESWEWVRLGNIILQNIGGGTPNKGNQEYWNGDIPWASVKDLNVEFLTETQDYITKYGLENSSTNIVPKDNIIIATRMGLRKVCNNKIDVAINQDLRGLIFLNEIVSSYFMKIYPILKFSSSGTTVKGISLESLNSHLIPLPPLAEQKRIVTQIERALEKVEVYAESYNKLQELDRAFPDKLKKSILQYAMQGKLVAQDPNDEPVEVLLEKIRAEKQKLYEEGKLKKKDLAEIVVEKGDDNSPYGNNKENSGFARSTMPEIPNSWSYVRFGEIVLFNIGKTPPRSETTYWGVDIPWVSISDMPNSGYITKTKECISHLAIKQTNIKIVPADTLLMSFKLSIGKVAILDVPASHNEAIISIFPYSDKKNIIRNYLMMFLPLISTAGNSKDAIKGKTLNSTSISELLIPISNYQEMKKIVSKVDLLFQKVAQLYD